MNQKKNLSNFKFRKSPIKKKDLTILLIKAPVLKRKKRIFLINKHPHKKDRQVKIAIVRLD